MTYKWFLFSWRVFRWSFLTYFSPRVDFSHSLASGWANSFICLIEIQAKNVFFRVFASAIGEISVFSDDLKTAFLQHPYRPDVVRCCPGENRPIYNKVEHPIERLSR